MRTWLCLIALSLAMSVPAMAGDRAGSFPWPVGADGVTVIISPPFSNANYSAVVQPTNTSGYSTVSECTYFNVLKLEKDNFQVQHKTCKGGDPVKVDTTITLNWIAVTKPE